MKKIIVILFFCSWFYFPLHSSTTDSISTIYSDGEFITYCQVSVNAADTTAGAAITKLTHQMCYNLDELSKWGLKGMRLANEKNELLIFNFKKTVYNKKTGVLRGIGDVIVPGMTTIPNLYVDSKLSQKSLPNGRREIRLDLVSANTFLKKMVGVCTYVPKGKSKTGYYTLETRVQFGWFFNVFITQNKYKKILEWRLKQLVYNLKEEAEKKEKK